MNINNVLTMDYENISNWAICENKPKQTQCLPAIYVVVGQSQYNAALCLFAVGSRTEIIILFKSLSGKYQLIFAVLSDSIL